jgi:hypothetical protein
MARPTCLFGLFLSFELFACFRYDNTTKSSPEKRLNP